MISLTGRHIAQRTRSTWTCFFQSGRSSDKAKTKKLFYKQRKNPKSFIAFIKPVSPMRWRRCRRDVFSRLGIISGKLAIPPETDQPQAEASATRNPGKSKASGYPLSRV